MQINIAGEVLDMYATDLSFERQNSLFDLKKSYADSTYNFDVPATAKNNAIFRNANMLAVSGAEARKYHNAQLQMDGYVTNGRLYIVSCTPETYKCCLLVGDSVRFKEIFEDMTLKDLFAESDGYIINNGTNTGGTGIAAQYLRFVKYDNGQAYQMPCVQLKPILDKINAKITLSNVPNAANYAALIPNTYTRPTDIRVTFQWTEKPLYPNDTEVAGLVGNELFFAFHRTDDQGDKNYFFEGGPYFYGNISLGYMAKQDLAINFPDDFPDDCFVFAVPATEYKGQYIASVENLYTQNNPEYFAGEYYFNTLRGATFGRAYGVPLAGRSVSIKAGTLIQFVKAGSSAGMQTVVVYNTGETSEQLLYSFFAGTADFTSSSLTKEQFKADRMYIKDWVPATKVFDFLQAVANMYGFSLLLESNAVQFVNYAMGSLFLDGKLYSVGEITRTIEGYGQKNKITYPVDAVNQKNALVYTLSNETLEEEKDIAEIPYNNGWQKSDDTLRLDDITYSEEDKDGVTTISVKSNTKSFGVAIMGTQTVRFGTLRYIGDIKRNALIEQLIKGSTHTTAEVRMSAAEMLKVSQRCVVYLHGVRYVWRTIKWANGVATFDLQKIEY